MIQHEWFVLQGTNRHVCESVAVAIRHHTHTHVECVLERCVQDSDAIIFVKLHGAHWRIRYDVRLGAINLADLQDVIIQINLTQ